MRRLRLASAFLLAFSFTTQLSATEPTAPPAAGSVWTATAGGVAELDRSTGALLSRLEGTDDARAVRVDSGRGVVWVSAGESLLAFGLDGTPVFSLPAGTKADSAYLELGLGDGTAWLASGEVLRGYAGSGQQLLEVELSGAVVGTALDGPRGLVWVATESAVSAFDPVTGAELRTLDLGEEEPRVAALALEPVKGELWVALSTSLRRYDAEGEPLSQLPLLDLVRVAGALPEGLWAVAGGDLLRIEPDEAGTWKVSWSADLPETERAWDVLAGDGPYRSVWVSDGRQLLRWSPGGWIESAWDLGEESRLAGLDAVLPAADEEPPDLAFTAPEDGAEVSESPAVELSWADALSGIDPASLRLALDGEELAADCSPGAAGASCTLEAPLPEGEVELSAAVRDFAGNASPTARVRVTVEAAEPPDPEPPSPGVDPVHPFQPVQIDRGLKNNHVFLSGSDIEAINTANGNLVLSIPLGQVYEVGLLSYQIRLTYNGQLWQPVTVECYNLSASCDGIIEPAPFSLPNPASNAGLGWEVHFGRLYAPHPPAGLSREADQLWPVTRRDRWLYVAPDGSTHPLDLLRNRPILNGAGLPVRWSTDSSHLRMQQTNATTIEIEHPDGTVSVFTRTAEIAGTLFCGNGVSGCWRFAERRDPYGNKMTVSYARSGFTETWTVADSVGRSHLLVFSLDPAKTGGGDSSAGLFEVPNAANPSVDDEWGDLRRVLETVVVATFNGTQAVYSLEHNVTRLARGCPHDKSPRAFPPGPLNDHFSTLRTAVLETVRVPEAQDYHITTLTPPGVNLCSRFTGLVTAVQVPSRGTYQYDWGNWQHPTFCDFLITDPSAPLTYLQTGVIAKRLVEPSGLAIGEWTYSPSLVGPTFHSGPACDRADYRITKVRGPQVNGRYTETWHYHSVAEGPESPMPTHGIGDWQATDFGLPYAKDLKVGSGPADYRFLSRQVYDCTTAGGCGDPVRSVYVRYAMEFHGDCDKRAGDQPPCFQIDPQMTAERTVFHDDGGRHVETRYLDSNGAGRFRRSITSDTFDGGHSIETATDWTATGSTVRPISPTTGYLDPGTPSSYLPALTAPWILHPYSERDVKEGARTHRTRALFNAQGLVQCMRRFKNTTSNPSTSAHDLVSVYTYGSGVGNDAGKVVQEVRAGGDEAMLGGGVCSTGNGAGAGSRYTLTHEYAHGQLKRSYTGSVLTFHARIDQNTGLPKSTFNVSDQRTALVYDSLGRLIKAEEAPGASLDEADTDIIYSNPATGFPKATVRRIDAGSILTEETYTYDYFGRLWLESRRRPGPGGAGFDVSQRRTTYDEAGRVKKETTWQDGPALPNLAFATEYLHYDPFGRPEAIRRPDNTQVDLVYMGERLKRTTTQVALPGGTGPVVLKTFADGFGRVTKETVEADEGAGFTTVQATYSSYDPSGNLIQATRTNGPACSIFTTNASCQHRVFDYDGRGFLTREELPELGAAGQVRGWITYGRSALGSILQKNDQQRTLSYDYDDGGRLLAVREGTRLWQEYEYGLTNSFDIFGANYRLNKLIRSVRHNYPLGFADSWAIEERYEYRERLSQLSKKTTQITHPLLAPGLQYDETLAQSWTYDSLGNVVTMTYPQCTTTGQDPSRTFCNDGNDLLPPAHTVTTAYNQGMPVAVTSSLGPSASYDYHPNFQLAQVEHSNGTTEIFDQGTNGMVRPRRIQVKSPTNATLFDTLFYSFDTAGNISRIGADTYTYDGRSRLLAATVKNAGASRSEAYTYDTFGNVETVVRDGGATPYPWTGLFDLKNRYLGESDILYDLAGNQTAIGSRWSMAYDALNMQTQFEDTGQAGITVTPYDGILGGPTVPKDYRSVYAPGNYRLFDVDLDASTLVRTFKLRDVDGKVLREYKVEGFGTGANWDFEKDFIHGPDGVFATRDKATVQHFFHQDHLGSRRLITSGTGTLLGETDYYPYGFTARDTGPQEPTAKYTGHERDEHGFTDYMLGRTCQYPFMRFASVDPGRDGWNLYAYVGDNPTNFVDPDGENTAVLSLGLGLLALAYILSPDVLNAPTSADDYVPGGQTESAIVLGGVMGPIGSKVGGAFQRLLGSRTAGGGTSTALRKATEGQRGGAFNPARSVGAAGNRLQQQLANLGNKAVGETGRKASSNLQRMARKAGLEVKPGGKHIKVINPETGSTVTVIPHSPHAKGTIKAIAEAIMKEAGF